MNNLTEDVYSLLVDTLQIDMQKIEPDERTNLLGNIPELDSMAVVTVISALESRFGFFINDDDDIAAAFETFGSLVDYVNEKSTVAD